MKKLYNPNKGAKRIHPSPLPPPHPPLPSSSYLSALPTALLALASTLSPEEQEVLAYLLGCNNNNNNNSNKSTNSKNKSKKMKTTHPPELGCSCFGCYKSFWARWDSSPNRQVIHAIIDAFEESLESRDMVLKIDNNDNTKSRKKRNLKSKKKKKDEEIVVEEMKADDAEKADDGYDGFDEFDEEEENLEEEEEEKSSVRKFVSWVFGINN